MRPKTKKIEQCQKCQKEFHIPYNSPVELCPECIESLLKCYICGIICGQEWGYFENPTAFILKKGKEVILCGSCAITIKRKGYLLFDGAKAIPDRWHKKTAAYYRRRLCLDGTLEWVMVPDDN